jgi:hypothetical protein
LGYIDLDIGGGQLIEDIDEAIKDFTLTYPDTLGRQELRESAGGRKYSFE